MKTKIIVSYDRNIFCKKLDEALADGWQTKGDMVVTFCTLGRIEYYIQLMIKEEKK